MAHMQRAILDNRGREDAGHPTPLRIPLCKPINLIIRTCDRFPKPARRRARFFTQSLSYEIHGLLGSDFAGRFSAHAVHNKDAAFRITQDPVPAALPFLPGLVSPQALHIVELFIFCTVAISTGWCEDERRSG